MKKLLIAALFAGLAGAISTGASALPVLDNQVDTPNRVVTVGDMFKEAGPLADQPLFLAPAPGTSGVVSIDAIRLAAAKVGLDEFDDQGAAEVRVSRLSTPVTAASLNTLINTSLKSRGLLTGGVTAISAFDVSLDGLQAAATPDPVQLLDLRYSPESGLFAARFALAGVTSPLDVTGHIELVEQAPALTASLDAGTILSADDLVEQQVPVSLLGGDAASADELIGKALLRQSRAGVILRTSDVGNPQVITRNDIVTIYLHAGAMTLTVKGTALNSASVGETVAVLNTISKRVVHGIANADGSVEISATPLSVAGL